MSMNACVPLICAITYKGHSSSSMYSRASPRSNVMVLFAAMTVVTGRCLFLSVCMVGLVELNL